MRTFVILGIILIVVSIVGAKWALDHQSPVATTTTNEKIAGVKPANNLDTGERPSPVFCF